MTLNFTAPAGGVAVALSSNSTVASVPSSLTVPAGATSASFTVTTSSVAANTNVSISGTLAGTTQAATLTVTVPTAPLPAPSLMFPADGSRFSPGQPITFMWSSVTGASSYTLQIDDSNTFSLPLVLSQTVVGTNQVTISTFPTAKLWWRVRANSASGTPGAWSSVRQIEVKV